MLFTALRAAAPRDTAPAAPRPAGLAEPRATAQPRRGLEKSYLDFDVRGCRHSLPEGIMRAMDVMTGGKRVLASGFGEMGKGYAFALRGAGEIYIFTLDMGDYNIITLPLMKNDEMKRRSSIEELAAQ
eukprot:11798153-Heterocapsa_arctica.AAC.1